MTRIVLHPSPAGSAEQGRSWLLRLAGATFLLAGAALLIPARPPVATPSGASPRAHATFHRPHALVLKTKPIQEIRLGDRVAGENPTLETADRQEPLPEANTWRHLKLRMASGSSHSIHIELLRPTSWLDDREARVGERIHLDLPEMNAVGDAEVLAIDACPRISPGSGSIVTGLFVHTARDNLVSLYVEGLPDAIGVTDQHPFWSEDRQSFVAAGELNRGECLRTGNGTAVRVMAVVRRTGNPIVYNFEVNGEHVYLVSQAAILVHNASCKFVVDSSVFQSRDPPALNKIKDAIVADKDINVSTTEAVFGEIGDRRGHGIISNLAFDDRLSSIDVGADVQNLLAAHPDVLSKAFGAEDLSLAVAAQKSGLPIVTVNSRLKTQLSSNALRKSLFPDVKVFVVGDDIKSVADLKVLIPPTP